MGISSNFNMAGVIQKQHKSLGACGSSQRQTGSPRVRRVKREKGRVRKGREREIKIEVRERERERWINE